MFCETIELNINNSFLPFYKMDLNIHLDKNHKIDNNIFQKMILLYNAIEDGWTVKKHENSYVFQKKHENKKEVIHEDYLARFLKSTFDFEKIMS